MKHNLLKIAVAVILITGCGQRKAEQFQALPFPDVFPPAMMEDAQDRVEYMALNTWNKFVDPAREYPCDSTLVSGVSKKDVEQKFATWCQLLDMAGQKSAQKAINKLYDTVVSCEKVNTSLRRCQVEVRLDAG